MEETKEPPQSSEMRPKPQNSDTVSFFCCEGDTNKLHRMNLLTGVKSCHKVPNYLFKYNCCWSELPDASLLITGGGDPEVSEASRFDSLREYAHFSLPPMHTARAAHATVYHSQYLYVLGGWGLSECERYNCTESRWEVLPALPVGGDGMCALELENCVYALGGRARFINLDTVQKLSLDSLTWELMQLKLPQPERWFPCFKIETQVYLVINKTLYSFTPFEVKPIKFLPLSSYCYSSYYIRGTIYYEESHGIRRFDLGEFISLSQ
jgi:hypothetical protein